MSKKYLQSGKRQHDQLKQKRERTGDRNEKGATNAGGTVRGRRTQKISTQKREKRDILGELKHPKRPRAETEENNI